MGSWMLRFPAQRRRVQGLGVWGLVGFREVVFRASDSCGGGWGGRGCDAVGHDFCLSCRSPDYSAEQGLKRLVETREAWLRGRGWVIPPYSNCYHNG